MPFTAIIAIFTIAIAVWIRSITWHNDQERPITVNLALQGVAVFLMLPDTSRTLGEIIYRYTGVANVPNLIAHDCYIVAGSMILFSSMWYLIPDNDALRIRFRRHVEYPCTLCIPILAFLFLRGSASKHQVSNFFAFEGDLYTKAYWMVLTCIIGYTLIYSVTQFARIVGHTPRVFLSYIVSAAFGAAACIVKFVTGADPHIPAAETSSTVWATATLCGTGFALIAGWNWFTYKRRMASDDGILVGV